MSPPIDRKRAVIILIISHHHVLIQARNIDFTTLEAVYEHEFVNQANYGNTTKTLCTVDVSDIPNGKKMIIVGNLEMRSVSTVVHEGALDFIDNNGVTYGERLYSTIPPIGAFNWNGGVSVQTNCVAIITKTSSISSISLRFSHRTSVSYNEVSLNGQMVIH